MIFKACRSIRTLPLGGNNDLHYDLPILIAWIVLKLQDQNCPPQKQFVCNLPRTDYSTDVAWVRSEGEMKESKGVNMRACFLLMASPSRGHTSAGI